MNYLSEKSCFRKITKEKTKQLNSSTYFILRVELQEGVGLLVDTSHFG